MCVCVWWCWGGGGAEETGGKGWMGQVDLEGREDGDDGRDTIRLSNRHKDDCCTEAKGMWGIQSINTLPSVCSFVCVCVCVCVSTE